MADMTTKKAGYVATEVLARAGVRRLYTVPGESFLEILDASERHPDLALISTRHESGASFMAEADAKLTGTPAVAMATRGVGASNLAIGVHTARQDSTPMLVLLGQVETDFLGREAFQEVDLSAFYAPITKWSATVNRADRLAEFVARGLRIATSGRPGPVMLALPADVLGEVVSEDSEARVTTQPLAGPAPEAVRSVVDRLAAARRPVVIAGGRAQGAQEALVTFAEAWDLGVYAAFRRQDVFPNEHPNYLGHLTLGTPPETLTALQEADLVFVVGCRLSEVTTQSYSLPRADQVVIQIDAGQGPSDDPWTCAEPRHQSLFHGVIHRLGREPSPGDSQCRDVLGKRGHAVIRCERHQRPAETHPAIDLVEQRLQLTIGLHRDVADLG